jgi:hypothetical protein
MMWRRKKRIDPAELAAQADAATAQIRTQQDRVNVMADWFERRKNTNGFGDDFEWTLKPKGSQ